MFCHLTLARGNRRYGFDIRVNEEVIRTVCKEKGWEQPDFDDMRVEVQSTWQFEVYRAAESWLDSREGIALAGGRMWKTAEPFSLEKVPDADLSEPDFARDGFCGKLVTDGD